MPGVLGCRPLRRTIQVCLGFDLGFGISDLGFLSTIYDIELNSSDFTICFLVLTYSSANFKSAFRNRRPGGPSASPCPSAIGLASGECRAGSHGGQARPSSSRSLRSAQARTASGICDKRVPRCMVWPKQFMKHPG